MTIAYSKPCHILSHGIFRTGGLLKALWNVDQTCSGIFRTLYNACICRNLTYSESWNIQNPSITISQHIFRTLSNLRKFTKIQNSDIFKTLHMCRTLSKIWDGVFCKYYTYFSKELHLRFLTRFWIHNLSVSTN